MQITLKCIIIFRLFVITNESFHLYNTNVPDNHDYRDCLYSLTLKSDKNEWQLVPYCITHNATSTDAVDGQCYGNKSYTFEQLKLQNVNSYHLYGWNAPIDTINDYEKYRTGYDLSLGNHRYCNCSAPWFGTQCQYSFLQTSKTATFDDIIMSQFKEKSRLDTEQILNNRWLLTCYEGLQCRSLICLDWRQICDGIINCENGEDEPAECLQLETNECKNDEHRCRSGMCIPRTFLIDFSIDCMDLSDETETYKNWPTDTSCYSTPTLTCDFRLCSMGYFSCGDGQCVRLSSAPHTSSCQNFRDVFLRQHLIMSTTQNVSNTSNNISSECRHLMMCLSTTNQLYIDYYAYRECECLQESMDTILCLEYFRNHCPTSFFFHNEVDFLYPFVQSLYHNTLNHSTEWWLPTHFCYNRSQCPTFPIAALRDVDGLSCFEAKANNDLPVSYRELALLFSAGIIPHTSELFNDERLFYCDRSMKFISKHRVSDDHFDCFYEEDEYLNSTITSTLNLTYIFKCKATNQSFPRPLIGGGICDDYSDTLYIGGCKTASDIGCQSLRGLYTAPVYYVFQENCNGNRKIINSTVANETDETNCEEWSWPRNRPCDGYWDNPNGDDELNCPNTVVSYITHRIFNCSANEHYCTFKNGDVGCLSKEFAGDGIVHCLGNTDDRATSCAFLFPLHPFECFNFHCIELFALCDGKYDCPDGEDELVCPSLFKCDYPDFTCDNGNKCIERTKQCDGIIDCQPNGEDEMFCDLASRRITQFSLDKIEAYPPVVDSRNLIIAKTAVHPFTSLSVNILFKSKNFNRLKEWFCNRGIIVKTRSLSNKCLCPPSYYGQRCEYQAERLLITVRIDVPVSLNGYQNQYNAIRLVACLMLNNTVVHHEQIVHVISMKQMFYLNYPRPPPKQHGNWSVRFDAFLVTSDNVDFKASWLFKVPFSFLPFNRLVLHLTLRDQDSCSTLTCLHGTCKKYLNSPHHEYCQCEQNWSGDQCDVTAICSCAGGGKCINRYPTPICVCPLGRMGNECQMLFDPCTDVRCHNGGTCLPIDERQFTNSFMCSCRSDFYGPYCELTAAKIDIAFSDSLSFRNPTLSAAIFVHFLELQKNSPGILFVQNRLLVKQVKLNEPIRVFNSYQQYLSPFILLQIFFEPDKFDYYIGGIIKSQITNISSTIYEPNRCPHADELLSNETIRKFPSMKKVKYYSRICEASNSTNCFHDEAFLCFCYKDRLPDCLFFQQEPTQCTIDYCKNNGRCVQNNFNGVWNFGCVCSGCAYGSLCQLTTSQYALSLDAMLGQDIRENISLKHQPFLIKLVLATIILIFALGLVSNILSVITFKQPKVQEVGCGMYLFCLPLVGQLGLSVFAGRFFYLLGTQMYNVDNFLITRWSCIGLEYFLNVCPMLFDWLTACVAVERCINIIKGVSFKKSNSIWWAKRVIFLLIAIVLGSAWHEPFIHQLIDDPRVTNQHPWCVITFSWAWLEYYRLTINLINLIVPCFINIVATVFLLHKSTRMKMAFTKRKKSGIGYLITLKKQLPMYGSPLGLIILSLMRLIFSFTLVCIIYQWQKYIYLMAYFISFMPLMGTFPIFVWPADTYKKELKKSLKQIRRKWTKAKTEYLLRLQAFA